MNFITLLCSEERSNFTYDRIMSFCLIETLLVTEISLSLTSVKVLGLLDIIAKFSSVSLFCFLLPVFVPFLPIVISFNF